MFVFDAAALLTPTEVPDAGPTGARRPLPARLLAAIAAHRRLRQRHRALPRPAACGWVPRRGWRRHSALLCLCAGVDPDKPGEDSSR
jgi:hypothetical protein